MGRWRLSQGLLGFGLLSLLLLALVPGHTPAVWGQAQADTHAITGKVTDLSGEPVVGVDVQVCDLSKRPVLLVRGGDGPELLVDDVDGLAHLYQWMQADGYVEGCNLFYAKEVSAYNNKQENRLAMQMNLRAAYDQLIVYYPNWQGHFDIIGHSFGGLISRFYLESPLYNADQAYGTHGIQVANLITLGTPHGGARVPDELYPGAMLIAGAPLFSDFDIAKFIAVAELSSVAMDAYNAGQQQPAGVAYHLIGGDFMAQEGIPIWIRALYAPYTADPGDIAVSLRSAGELGLNPKLAGGYPRVCLLQNEDMHGYTDAFGLGDMRSYVRPSATYDAFIRDVLGSNGANCPAKMDGPASATIVDYQGTTGEGGQYSIDGLAPGDYRVIPTLAGGDFFAAFRSVTLPPDASGVDFVWQGGERPLAENIFCPVVISGWE